LVKTAVTHNGKDYMWKQQEREYLTPYRLSDVLALIQVLAFDIHAHRSEEGIRAEIQIDPRSAATWSEVASQHPEFFRSVPGEEHGVSLIARHVTPRGVDRKHPRLQGDQVDSLLKAAIEMHDRQASRADRWKSLLPLWTALLSVIGTLAAVWVGGKK
jgi:hypothetical protein